MLKITPDPQFTIPVELTIPGQKETGTMKCTFKYLNADGIVEFWKDNEGRKFWETVGEVLVAWDLPEEYTPENLKTFLTNYPSAGYEILMAYQESVQGSRVKNLRPSRLG